MEGGDAVGAIPEPNAPFCRILLTEPRPGPSTLVMWHDNLNAVVASHQDTILGSAEMGYAHRQPNADRQQGNREGERGHIRQHPLPIIIGLLGDALIARKVVGDLEAANKRGLIAALDKG
jgi:hypothetical protein